MRSLVEDIATPASINLPTCTVAALLAATDVSEQAQFAAMARLGLQITQSQEAL